MTRRDFLGFTGTALAANQTGGSAPPQLPNIVYILADDLGWGDLGCYNSKSAIPTPNADRLARQGMRFTDMHSPSAVCTPTRYGILTGRYCWRSSLKKGVLWGYSPNLIEPDRLTVPGLLKQKGYYTAGVGKWHLGLGAAEKTDYDKALRPGPLDHGFDYYFGIPASLIWSRTCTLKTIARGEADSDDCGTEGAAGSVLAARSHRARLCDSGSAAHADGESGHNPEGARRQAAPAVFPLSRAERPAHAVGPQAGVCGALPRRGCMETLWPKWMACSGACCTPSMRMDSPEIRW
jgi:Arylsulfatase A and related enzymes